MTRNSPAPPASPFAMEQKHSSGLWALLGLGVLLMLVAALAGAEEKTFTATRTDRFNAQISSSVRLRVENVSGDIVASSGKEFSAIVTTTVTATTQNRADEILRKTEIAQTRRPDEYMLETRWPDSRSWSFFERDGRTRRHAFSRCQDCRIASRYELTVPPGMAVELKTVNGSVETRRLAGAIDLRSTNGAIRAEGARRSVTANTVNGKIEIAAEQLPADASVEARTINGSVLLTLPKEARFDLSASTMNGAIASSFPLPAREEASEAEAEAAAKKERLSTPSPPRPPATRRVVVRGGDDEVVVDTEDLDRDLERSMKEVEIEVRRSLHDAARELRLFSPRREYHGSIGQAGAKVRLSALNGAITVLAAGTKEADAKPLVSRRRSFVVTVPRVDVHVAPMARISPGSRPVPAPVAIEPQEGEESFVRGDVAGDLSLSTTGARRAYEIGNVSGSVRIVTGGGEIHVASAGKDAELKTYGGDIRIGSVSGDLKAQTLAGEIRAKAISGGASLETSGGDIRVGAIAGFADAKTGAGDIVLTSVKGRLLAETGGGDVRVAVGSREVKGGVTIRNSGGDVSLTLPADFRGQVELEVRDAGSDEIMIRSDFPEVAVTRHRAMQSAAGMLNGGGTRVTVSTRSGSIRLLKGPPASR